MEKNNLKEKQTETERKEPYEPPKAIFIPLRNEERLMACAKLPSSKLCKNAGDKHS